MPHTHSHSTTPTQVLVDEHTVILKVLGSLELVLQRIEKGDQPDLDLLGRMVDFFRGYADKCHHAKEEDLLFPAMEEAGMPREGGPVGVMLEEHDQGRAYVGEIASAIEQFSGDADGSRQKILNNGWAFLQLLQAHIHKENEILFPMADRVIGSQEMHGLMHAFEDTQAKLEEKSRRFVEMADEFQRQLTE